MNWHAWKPTRRDLLHKFLAGLTALAAGARPGKADAAKLQKADVAYQDRPKDGKRCAACRAFSAATTGAGTCAVVEGEVSANGWCTAYSPRPLALRSPPGSAMTGARSAGVRITAVTHTANVEEGVLR